MKNIAALLILLSCVFYQTPIEALSKKWWEKKIIPKASLPSLDKIPSKSPIVASDDSHEQCKATVLPSFINNSMYWTRKEKAKFPILGEIGKEGRLGKSAYKALDALSPPSVIVTIAGNKHPEPVPDIKTKASKNFDAIIVGSLDPDGKRSNFSQQGEAVHIMAPSDMTITSVNDDGTYRQFGGTSGAAPLVTSSLAGFEWLSGYHPTAKESKIILEKTAIPTQYSYDKPRKNGVGMVNAYKLGMVGKELKRLCGKNISCFKTMIKNPDVYKFPEDYGIEEAVGQAFPECSENCGGVVDQQCTDKEAVFKRLRKASFLNPSNKKLWSYLACIYNKAGFTEDARAMVNTLKAVSGAGTAYKACRSDDDCTLVPNCSYEAYEDYENEDESGGILVDQAGENISTQPRPIIPSRFLTMTKAEAGIYYATRACNEQCNGKCRCNNEETTVSGASFSSQCINSQCVLSSEFQNAIQL